MAVDAYREVSPAEARRWMRRAGDASGCGEREFQNIALQRALKALGTFGFQVTRRKNVRYLPPIARTVRYALRYMQAPSDEWEPVISALRQVEVG
jgi:aminoglycoside/choline kinase family phosphotransferase